MSQSPVIVVLDYPSASAAMSLVERLDPALCRLKVGKELFTAAGPAFVESLVAKGYDVFLDLKYHDIPNTVAGACRAAARLGVWMVNVHACGGRTMLAAAREAIDAGTGRKPLLIGVTVLTSLTSEDLAEVGVTSDAQTQVMRLAGLCVAAGLDGVVCSAQEAPVLRDTFGAGFLKVTPGIRLPDDAKGDQQRVVTPVEAIKMGATHLVIGRSITSAPDPIRRLAEINQQLAALAPTLDKKTS